MAASVEGISEAAIVHTTGLCKQSPKSRRSHDTRNEHSAALHEGPRFQNARYYTK